MPLEKDKLQQQLMIAFDEFITAFSDFDEKYVNDKPNPKRWSAVQVALHIIKATDGLPDVEIKPLDREVDALLPMIRPWWEDLNQKFESPEPLKPDDELHSKQEVLTELLRVRSKDLNMIATEDLTPICLDFELPTIGYLTRYEWLWFIQMHLKRHTYQLENMINRR